MTIIVASSGAGVAASDVPTKFDVIINGAGYRFADYEKRRAAYSFSPTFVPRSNIQGDYGDNQQEFWQTHSQRDWSLGEQQKFYRAEEGRDRRFWQGENIDIRTPGQVTLRQATLAATFAAAVRACCPRGAAVNQNILAASSTNLYEIDAAGTITDRGAHGLGRAPERFGVVSDGTDIYISSTGSGTVGMRKWDGSTYATFSANGADALEFLNNTLYGLRSDNAKLVKWDTAGTQSDVFQWKQADGGVRGGTTGRLRALGGKLLVLWADGPNGPELYSHDGTAPSLIAAFPRNFYAHDLDVVAGVAFVSGSFVKVDSSGVDNLRIRPAIFFWANGQIGLLWRSTDFLSGTITDLPNAGHPALAAYDEGLVLTDDERGMVMFYDIASGGVHSIAEYTVAGSTPLLAASQRFFLHTRAQTSAYVHPSASSIATAGEVTQSLVDFDSSLQKRFKSAKIDAIIPTGASIDLAYRMEDLDGAYTSIVTGASSGTEYAIDANGRAISIKTTLKKGTASTSPVLKRVFTRAAPILDTFKRREYVLDLGGRDGKSPLKLRDGTPHGKDAMEMATALNTAAISTTPIKITDRFSTYEGVVEPESYQLIEVRPEEFVALVRIREV